METTQITEIVTVKIKSSEEEVREFVMGNSIIPIAKLLERYRRAKEFYIERGYNIVAESIDDQSFVAEKKYMSDDMVD